MKKRLLALLCAVAALLTILVPWSSAAGFYDGVYLVGVNDTVLLGLINESQMPVRRGSVIYAPYTVLDNKELELNYALNRNGGTFAIFNRARTLVFQLNGSGSTDKEGGSYPQGIITRNGVVYIPLRFVSNFFGLSYSFYNLLLPEGPVPIARLRTADATLGDTQFGTQAAQLVAGPLAQYMAAQATPEPSPSAWPTPSPTPVVPTPTPSVAPQAANVSFAIECTDPNGFSDVLSALDQSHVKALFLFPVDSLAQQDSQVRAAAASGHQVGLLLTSSDPQAEFAQGSSLLSHILRYEATQVSLQGDAATAAEAIEEAPPWWRWRENLRLRSGSASSQARSLIQDIENRGNAYVSLSSSSRAAQVLRRALPTLTQRPYTILLQTESSVSLY